MKPNRTRVQRFRPVRGPAAAAFSLLEVLLALAVLALVGSLFIAGGSTFLRARQPSVEDLFWQAVATCSERAVESGRPVVLAFDPEQGALRALGEDFPGSTLPIPGGKIEFLSATDRRTVLLGGEAVGTAVVPHVRFYPEGTCDAFRAQLTDAAGRRNTIRVDPWTCAPVLSEGPGGKAR